MPPEHLAGLPARVIRDYELADRFGWTPDEIDAAPAIRTDWMLEVARTIDRARENRREKALREARSRYG